MRPVKNKRCFPDSNFYTVAVNFLTRIERKVVAIAMGLLMTGWAVQTFRTAQEPNAESSGQPNINTTESAPLVSQ